MKHRLLGCGHCYTHFEEKLQPLLRRIHGNTRHTGRCPGGLEEPGAAGEGNRKLKSQLKAVSREEFERAAQLRDAIRDLEKTLEEGGEA